MRILGAAVLAAVVGACTTEDPRPLRPPGGGGSGGTTDGDGPDASPSGDGGDGSLTGTVCVIDRFDAPLTCPAGILRTDVLVEAIGVGVTRSDDVGAFAFETTAGAVILEVGGEVADGLVTTRTRVDVARSPVDGLVVEQGAWDDALNQLQESLFTGGAVLVYIRDADGPVAGATLTVAGEIPQDARLYYDDAAGGFDPAGIETSLDGMALLLDVTDLQVTATDGTRSASAEVPTTVGGVGIVFLELP